MRTPPRTIAIALIALGLVASGCASTTEPGKGPDRGSSGQSGQNGTKDGEPGGPRALDDHGQLASLARELLSDTVPAATIEIDTTGRAMTARARDALEAALRDHGGKSVSLAPGTTVPAQDVYTEADLRALAKRERDSTSTTDRLALHVLVLEGRYEDADVLGVAFEATTFAIFPDQIESGLLPTFNYDGFEHAVVIHELGHLFGLVNLTGEGAFHEDGSHGGHSKNKGSVMYWAVEDISIANVFNGGPPTDFDSDDRTEMNRIRG